MGIQTQKQPNKEPFERRYAQSGVEMRKADTGVVTLRGYAAKFGSTYDMGWFTEEVSPTAFKNADMKDVRVLKNHDPNHILGRTKSGTARVAVDDVGLYYEVDLPDSPDGQNMRSAIERGDIDQSSWGFSLNVTNDGMGDEWERRNGKDHRTITDVKIVWDASPVTYPANPDTTIAKRSHDQREMNMESPKSHAIGQAAAIIESCNECIEACQDYIAHAEHHAKMDPENAGEYMKCAEMCAQCIEMQKMCIESCTMLIASLNGQRKKNNASAAKAKAALALHNC